MNIDGNFPGPVTAALFAAALSTPAANRSALASWTATRSGVPKRNKDRAKAARKARKRQRRGW